MSTVVVILSSKAQHTVFYPVSANPAPCVSEKGHTFPWCKDHTKSPPWDIPGKNTGVSRYLIYLYIATTSLKEKYFKNLV